jgi:hypothetical protein
MGVAGSSFDNLSQDAAREALSTKTGLLQLLGGYCRSQETFDAIDHFIEHNWSKRGREATKERLRIMCAIGARGQGKTELCRQLVEREEVRLESVTKFVTVYITFNQNCTFTDGEARTLSLESSVVWRVLWSFGMRYGYENCPRTPLSSLLETIRKSQPGHRAAAVGVFLVVDEILKVPEKERKLLLSCLTGLQQRQLSMNKPTFILLTSLEVFPLKRELVTGCGQVLGGIPLPILMDGDLRELGTRVSEFIMSILGLVYTGDDMLKIKGLGHVEMLIRVASTVAGRHFRTLERVIQSLYGRLIPREAHIRAVESEIALKDFEVSDSRVSSHDPRQNRGTGFIGSISEMFATVISEIDIATTNDYDRTLDIFLALVYNPDREYVEDEISGLEETGVLYVKRRELTGLTRIVPRVCLPFLYLHPRLNSVPTSCENLGYLTGAPGTLRSLAPVLMHNIGLALHQSIEKLPDGFERVMPWAELLVVLARSPHCGASRQLPILDVLPSAIVVPWNQESLCVSASVFEENFVLEGMPAKTNTSADALAACIAAAVSPGCNALIIRQRPDQNIQAIEYVSRVFSVNGETVLCLSSMKFGDHSCAEDPVSVATKIHKFVRKLGSVAAKYYVFVYCCVPLELVEKDKLPPGTVIVPFECLQRILQPFGLSPLLDRATKKSGRSPDYV